MAIVTLKKKAECAICCGSLDKGTDAIWSDRTKQVYCLGRHVNGPEYGTQEYFLEQIARELNKLAYNISRYPGGNSKRGGNDDAQSQIPF